MIEAALSSPSVLSREGLFECKLLGSTFFLNGYTPPTSHRIGASARCLFTRDNEVTSWMVTETEWPAEPSVGEVKPEKSLESYLLRVIPEGRLDLLREVLTALEQRELYKTTVDEPRQPLHEPLYKRASKLWVGQEDIPMGPGTVMDPSVYEQDLSRAVITSTTASPS